MKKCLIFAIILMAPAVQAEDLLSIESALKVAFQTNPEIAASSARLEADRANIRSQSWLDNPKVGLMHENNMNLMQTQMGPMNTWSLTQEIKFPTKYFLMGSAQSSKAENSEHQLGAKKLEIRKKVLNAYYNLFSISKILTLLEAQRETLIEVARSAEARHATGVVPQQDEMKAHVEQTKIETEILNLKEEKDSAEADLNALLGREANEKLQLSEKDLPTPKPIVNLDKLSTIARSHSNQVKSALALSDEAEKRKTLAAWNYAPDFSITYKKAWSSAPADNYAVGIELSLPLWFFIKQSSDYKAASSQSIEAEKNLEKAKLDVGSETRSLVSKVMGHEKLLQIYNTSLVPQAASTMNSSRIAYQAGKINFLEFLDSERSLYAVKIAYYRTLIQYIDFLTRLEEVSSTSLSSLPFGVNL